jgi:dolichyl-phosphate beta-glucosyltransferase
MKENREAPPRLKNQPSWAKNMDVSIVIPAFNEASKIGRDVEAAGAFLIASGLRGEIIAVDDGSSDGTSEAAAAPRVPSAVERRVLRLERNSGKGAAVRHGVLQSRGRVVLYADSGTCIPFSNALPAIQKIMAGDLDLALASRRLKKTVIRRKQPLRRRMIGRIFRRAAVLVTGLPAWITDSQCGFKVYEGDIARELYSGLTTPGFLFELEIILKALKSGLRVEEFPVEWTCDLDTRLRPSRQAGTFVKELLQVRDAAKVKKP